MQVFFSIKMCNDANDDDVAFDVERALLLLLMVMLPPSVAAAANATPFMINSIFRNRNKSCRSS